MLEVNALDDVECARENGDGQQGQEERNLVSGQLGCRADADSARGGVGELSRPVPGAACGGGVGEWVSALVRATGRL